MLQTSERLTEGELAALRAMVPTSFEVEAEEGRVLLTFRSPSPTGSRTPLFSYEILPTGGRGFAGELLGKVVEDLAATVLRLHRERGGGGEGGMLGTALEVINGASDAVTRQHLRGGGLRILTADIHTLEEEEWFD